MSLGNNQWTRGLFGGQGQEVKGLEGLLLLVEEAEKARDSALKKANEQEALHIQVKGGRMRPRGNWRKCEGC